MVFSSLTFLCAFLPATLCLYALAPGIRAKNAVLIVCSLLFYAYGEPTHVALLLLSALANWGFGRAIERFERKRALLVCAVVANLAMLALFKYADFIVSSINGVFGLGIPLPGIALPVGISFFTFQGLSYVIDVYRGDVQAEHSFSRALLYLALFPQLIAGPIVKYHDIAGQIDARTNNLEDLAEGLRRFCFGLAKKVLLANPIALVADALFAASPEQLFWGSAWVAALAYTLEIYLDFSAYSDMAIGLGHCFGFSFKENFDHPYAAKSIQDFWRRWHISLSTWFKEYVYIPLGGNRRGPARAAINRLIVFALCGLWHGASWTFVAWGLYHGLFLLLEQYVPKLRKLPSVLAHLYTMLVVLVGWVLFRAESFSQAASMIAQLFTPSIPSFEQLQLLLRQFDPVFLIAAVAGAIACLPVASFARKHFAANGERPFPAALPYLAALVLYLVCVLELSAGGYNPFIYFRF